MAALWIASHFVAYYDVLFMVWCGLTVCAAGYSYCRKTTTQIVPVASFDDPPYHHHHHKHKKGIPPFLRHPCLCLKWTLSILIPTLLVICTYGFYQHILLKDQEFRADFYAIQKVKIWMWEKCAASQDPEIITSAECTSAKQFYDLHLDIDTHVRNRTYYHILEDLNLFQHLSEGDRLVMHHTVISYTNTITGSAMYLGIIGILLAAALLIYVIRVPASYITTQPSPPPPPPPSSSFIKEPFSQIKTNWFDDASTYRQPPLMVATTTAIDKGPSGPTPRSGCEGRA
jgi:hypothetical protein